MRVALAQIAPKLSRDNEALHVKIIKDYEDQCDLLIFPELSLNGYLLKDAVFEDAYTMEELERLPFIGAECDVIFGCVLREGHKVFNALVHASRNGIGQVYHKSTLPNYGLFQEARFFFAGEGMHAFETRFGRMVTVICEDLFNASIVADIAKASPDMVVVIANSPARGFGEKLEIEHTWNTLLSATALYSGAHVLFVNRVGFEDGLGFWGGSRIIDPNGNIHSKAPLFEENVLLATLDKTLSRAQKYLLRH